jgi:hypothetical protein
MEVLNLTNLPNLPICPSSLAVEDFVFSLLGLKYGKMEVQKLSFPPVKMIFRFQQMWQSLPGIAKANWSESINCLGRVFNFKLGCFVMSVITRHLYPLEQKLRGVIQKAVWVEFSTLG